MELGAHRRLKVFGRSVVVFEKEGCFNTLMVIESLLCMMNWDDEKEGLNIIDD